MRRDQFILIADAPATPGVFRLSPDRQKHENRQSFCPLQIALQREPYWTVFSAGCAIGYRKGAGAGIETVYEGKRQSQVAGKTRRKDEL